MPELETLPPPVRRAGRPFTEDLRIAANDSVLLEADSYQQYADAFLRPIEEFHGVKAPRITQADQDAGFRASTVIRERAIIVPGTKREFQFYCRELPARQGLEVYQQGLCKYGYAAVNRYAGEVFFMRPVFIPVLDSTCDTWMSLTPFEIISQTPGVKRARGSVLIGGLGVGWFARRVLQQPGVTRVTVVEREQGLIDFFGGPLKKEFGPRVRFVNGDAFEAVRPSAYDSALYDIWPGFGSSIGDKRWQRVAAKHPNAWAW